MQDYYQSLQIEDSVFDNMRADSNLVLKALIKNMVEKGSPQGSLTIKIDINLNQEHLMGDGDLRTILVPNFQHKVNSVMQIKGEMKGSMLFENMELVYDEDLKEYVLRPATRGVQSTIYDVDIDGCDEEDIKDGKEKITGNKVLQISGKTDDAVDVDFGEVPFDEEEDDYYDYED